MSFVATVDKKLYGAPSLIKPIAQAVSHALTSAMFLKYAGSNKIIGLYLGLAAARGFEPQEFIGRSTGAAFGRGVEPIRSQVGCALHNLLVGYAALQAWDGQGMARSLGRAFLVWRVVENRNRYHMPSVILCQGRPVKALNEFKKVWQDLKRW